MENINNISSIPWTAIISGVTLIAAILSPILTTIINNRYQLKLRKSEFLEKHKAEVIENYLKNVGAVINNPSNENFEKFGFNSKEVYLYVSTDHWTLLDDIENLIKNRQFSLASEKVSFYLNAYQKIRQGL